MDDDFAAWFTREILVHEAALTRYIKHFWAARGEIADIRQEVYAKVLEAAERQRPTQPKSFLYATAKNLLIDRARRHRIVPIDLLQEPDIKNVLVDELTPERTTSGLQQLVRLTEAFERLAARRRQVLWMRKVEDVSQKEIARQLGIAEATVEAHLVRAMRDLTKLFYGSEETETDQPRTTVQHETKHGQ
jgi:RNA polymerase sigma-70 factor (ECF subfamily)